VYRVENLQGKGPYRIPEEALWADHNIIHTRWPDPAKSIPIWRYLESHEQFEYVFGFLHLRDLHIWFLMPELTRLAKLGFHIAQYEVPPNHILHGRHQVAFIKPSDQ